MAESDGNQSKQRPEQPVAPPIYDPLAPEPSPPLDSESPSANAPTTAATPASPPPATTPEDDSTVGTGTSLALGCVAATLLLIVLGLILLGISAIT